ncbi:hypothetical protein PS900_04177 [Pseudomonas fluorescens]|uniref:OmpR/PhoB-type domain-containing protein n=1 Tax=Pseudomonas fluorescens TaxID=294 RepID=A0A8H2NUL1_PSEFL|nr:winged helix-turn-helix domain-containing protein [Pseudomonas fluorescens]VVP27458.1 hypothetical protein PS900_04177 [Pseudomonas fluorescens]
MLTAGSTLKQTGTSVLVIGRTQSTAESVKQLLISESLHISTSSYCSPLDIFLASNLKAIFIEVDTPATFNESLELVTNIRLKNYLAMIFIVFTHHRSVTKTKFLLAGADYCVKLPVGDDEKAKFVSEVFQAPEWHGAVKLTLDPTCLCLRGHEQILEISYQETQILNALINARNSILSHDDIVNVLTWNIKFYDPRALEKTISRLRGKIKNTYNINALHSVRGFGYRLCRGLILLK